MRKGIITLIAVVLLIVFCAPVSVLAAGQDNTSGAGILPAAGFLVIFFAAVSAPLAPAVVLGGFIAGVIAVTQL
jgi:hypothetical protein